MIAKEDLHGSLSVKCIVLLLLMSRSHNQCLDQKKIHREWGLSIVSCYLIGKTGGMLKFSFSRNEINNFNFDALVHTSVYPEHAG